MGQLPPLTLKKTVENRREGLKCSSMGEMACAHSSLKNKSQGHQNPNTSVKASSNYHVFPYIWVTDQK